jgi:hypothetical protein
MTIAFTLLHSVCVNRHDGMHYIEAKYTFLDSVHEVDHCTMKFASMCTCNLSVQPSLQCSVVALYFAAQHEINSS